jgi:hypothetical protein
VGGNVWTAVCDKRVGSRSVDRHLQGKEPLTMDKPQCQQSTWTRPEAGDLTLEVRHK